LTTPSSRLGPTVECSGTTPISLSQFIRQIGAALGVSAFVLAATVGGFRLGLLLMIAVSAGTFACVLALPAHSLHDAHQIDALE
jgi:hypothetical protein